MKTIKVRRRKGMPSPEFTGAQLAELKNLGGILAQQIALIRKSFADFASFTRDHEREIQAILDLKREADGLSGSKIRPKWNDAWLNWHPRDFVLLYRQLPSPRAHRPRIPAEIHRNRHVFDEAERRIRAGENREMVCRELAPQIAANSIKAARKQLHRKFPPPSCQ